MEERVFRDWDFDEVSFRKKKLKNTFKLFFLILFTLQN